jgi:hypothetical protein
MTVNEFKMWFRGFTDAINLDLSSGYDSSDLEDIFEAIFKKLDTVVPDVAPNQFPLGVGVPPSTPNQFPLKDVSPLQPNQFPFPKEFPSSPSIPGYMPNIYFTNNCDRLAPWPNSNSTIEDRGISK